MESTTGVPRGNPGTCGCTFEVDEFGVTWESFRDDCNTCFHPEYDSYTYEHGWDCDSECTCTWDSSECPNEN